MKRVLYPGSFDPITKGHMSVIKEASRLFDEVVVAILCNRSKQNSFFSVDERLDIIRRIYDSCSNIGVISSNGAAVDVAQEYECSAIVRGLRSLSDFDYEMQLAQVNREISDNKVSTICLFADNQFSVVSSSVVRELFGLDKDISRYVDPIVNEAMARSRRKK